MDRSFFAKRNHFFCERADCFRFCQSGANALMLDQTANLICQQRFSMLCSAIECYGYLLVWHREVSQRATVPVPLCAVHLSRRRLLLRPLLPRERGQLSFRVCVPVLLFDP